jgi:hypothetical protein
VGRWPVWPSSRSIGGSASDIARQPLPEAARLGPRSHLMLWTTAPRYRRRCYASSPLSASSSASRGKSRSVKQDANANTKVRKEKASRKKTTDSTSSTASSLGSPSEASKRMEEISKLLNKYNEAYYGRAVSLVSDEEYDRLFAELKALEGAFPDLAVSSSPTQTVGTSVTKSNRATVEHREPMLSLSNTYNEEDVTAVLESSEQGRRYEERRWRLNDEPG